VRDANYAIAAVMVGTTLVTWTLGRVVGRLQDPLALVRLIVIRVCIGLICAIVTAQAAVAGGLWLLLTPVVGLLALFSFALAGGYIWLWVRDGLGEDIEAPG